MNSPQTILSALEDHATTSPEKIAFTYLRDGETIEATITYQGLRQRAKGYASKILESCIPGDRVLLVFPPGLDFIQAFYGSLFAGTIAVPVNPPRINRPNQRLSSIIEGTDASLLLTTPDLKDKLPLWLNKFSSNKDVELSAISPTAFDEIATPEIQPPQTRSIAFIQFTSGSTGNPKGAMITHGNIVANVKEIERRTPSHSESLVLGWVPMFHDLGLVAHILYPTYYGFHSILFAPSAFIQKPVRWLEALSTFKASHTTAPTFAYQNCVDRIAVEQVKNIDLSKLKYAAVTAEPVFANTIEQFSEKFSPCGFRPEAYAISYGLAEATLGVTITQPNVKPEIVEVDPEQLAQNKIILKAGDGTRFVSSGKLAECLDCVLVNPENNKRVAPDEVGEVWVTGDTIAAGYWNQPDATNESFQATYSNQKDLAKKYFKTGDLGFFYQDELFITGRIKDLIIIRGKNIYPQDIEIVVEKSHPDLEAHASAAFSIETNYAEELIVCAEVTRAARHKLDAAIITAKIREAIFKFFEIQPLAICLLRPHSTPKTSSGKVQRSETKKSYLTNSLNTTFIWKANPPTQNFQIPASKPDPIFTKSAKEIKAKILSISTQLLGTVSNEFTAQHTFGELGLDSIKMVEMIYALESWLKIESLPPSLAWDFPTPERLANFITNGHDHQPGTIEHVSGAQRQINNEPIAIIGMGCRFPGNANSPASFWQNLLDQKDCVLPNPPKDANPNWFSTPSIDQRLTSTAGGFIKNRIETIQSFDPTFFGISPREALGLDPQQRLLLEVSWETLEDAGIPLNKIQNSQTGVFVGYSNNDYQSISAPESIDIDPYNSLGNASSIAAGRIAYWLDLHGPVLQIDTACSSSLTAIHQAVKSLQAGECEMAFAAGVNLILRAEGHIALSELQALSPDGQCKAFDARANGYVRGEGCGVVLLKPLSQAEADGDPIQAVILGTALNHDGRSNQLTAPNGFQQEKLLSSALKNAKLHSNQVGFIETHGTGTALGDPIEVNAIGRVFGQQREAPLWLGSVKSNIGHLEAAASIASLIKAIFVVKHGQIPAQLHFEKPNPHIDWQVTAKAIQIPTSTQVWDVEKRIAGVSAFGLSGTNVHVILQQPPKATSIQTEAINAASHLVTLSAHSPQALVDKANQLLHPEFISRSKLADVAKTMNCHRSHLRYRKAIQADSLTQLSNELLAIPQHDFQPVKAHSVRIAFLFSGQGSQYIQMARDLYQNVAQFKNTLDLAEVAFQKVHHTSLLASLHAGPENLAEATEKLNQTQYTQPALFAIEYGLAQIWQEFGVKPHLVLGHSIGEIAAACIAGVHSFEDGLLLAIERGRIMQSVQPGAMVSVNTSLPTLKKVLKNQLDNNTISIAAINASNQVVIAGTQQEIHSASKKILVADLRYVELSVSHAFHSTMMEAVLPDINTIADQLTYQPANIPMLLNVDGKLNLAGQTNVDPNYWGQQVVQTVQFENCVQSLQEQSIDTLVEIGPQSTLLGLATEKLPNSLKNQLAFARILWQR